MKDISFLKEKVKEIRKFIVFMIVEVKLGYLGGFLFVIDILIVFYFLEMNVDFINFKMEGRDRFVFLKGYVVFVIYVILVEKGYFLKDELMILRKFGSRF